MNLFNNKYNFGLIIKVLHWFIFILVAVQYAIMGRLAFLAKNSPDTSWYILLHKSVGLTIFCAAALMIISRQFGTRPLRSPAAKFQNLAAKIVHFLLYAFLILMPIGGIGMTLFSGRPLLFFGYPLMAKDLVPKNELITKICQEAHILAAQALLGLIVVHILAAFYHHFILKDNILKRMWFGR